MKIKIKHGKMRRKTRTSSRVNTADRASRHSITPESLQPALDTRIDKRKVDLAQHSLVREGTSGVKVSGVVYSRDTIAKIKEAFPKADISDFSKKINMNKIDSLLSRM